MMLYNTMIFNAYFILLQQIECASMGERDGSGLAAKAELRIGARGAASTLDPVSLERELNALRNYRDTLHDTMKGLVAKAQDKLGADEGELREKLEEVAAYLRNEQLETTKASQADKEALASALQREAEAIAALEDARAKAARDAEAARMHAAATAKLAADWKFGRESYEAQLKELRERLEVVQSSAIQLERAETAHARSKTAQCALATAMELAGLERALVIEASASLQLASAHREELAEVQFKAMVSAESAAALEREQWAIKLRNAEAVAEVERENAIRTTKDLATIRLECGATERNAAELERVLAQIISDRDHLQRTVEALQKEIEDLQQQLNELKLNLGPTSRPEKQRTPSRFVQYMAERNALQEYGLVSEAAAKGIPSSAAKSAPPVSTAELSPSVPRPRSGRRLDAIVGAEEVNPPRLCAPLDAFKFNHAPTATINGPAHANGQQSRGKQRGQMLLDPLIGHRHR
eukprot:scaffold149055_cov30-Tisochrysis_lutea.AAC.1